MQLEQVEMRKHITSAMFIRQAVHGTFPTDLLTVAHLVVEIRVLKDLQLNYYVTEVPQEPCSTPI